ncbi:DUF2794 domain-containing protein [Rhodobacter sp. KR11]|jgi:hypothetical protein|uniref:DUF2794 domain-containing protein n=1 Tax=Rhodobacter sp. KR11 TaxID=2974588 RepID=UPI00222241CB|nr:DUF2794 domain-containing protein [Rhodobacter sp. KR11]MCW1917185.1 DUF2794 domain-containing protein [Rhodobacter sp. KR11]
MTLQSPTPFPAPEVVCFDRREFGAIFSVYGRQVAAGEWRDYALTTGRDAAVFAIFRRAAEVPLYRIEKRPELRGRQGMFAVLGPDGRILRRGHDLAQVLRVLEKTVKVVE